MAKPFNRIYGELEDGSGWVKLGDKVDLMALDGGVEETSPYVVSNSGQSLVLRIRPDYDPKFM